MSPCVYHHPHVPMADGSLMPFSSEIQATKEVPGAHKRAQSAMPSLDDISLEEGLLANQEEDTSSEADLKDDVEVSETIVVTTPKAPERELDLDGTGVVNDKPAQVVNN